MKIHVPVAVVMYQEVEVDDGLDITLPTDEQREHFPEFSREMNVPLEMPDDVWTDHLAARIAESDIVGKLMGLLFDMRQDDPRIKAEISPCYGVVPFKDMN